MRAPLVTRPRLLFLGHTVPYPPDRGLPLRSYHILRHLASRYEVEALLFMHEDDPTQMPLEDRLAHLRRYARVTVYRVRGRPGGLRRGWIHAATGLWGRTEAAWRYGDRHYRRRVVELAVERDPRIVHVDGVVLHAHLSALTSRRVVLAHHRRESEHLRQQATLATGRDRGYLERQADALAGVEREWAGRVSANIVSSVPDAEALERQAPSARVELIPPAVDTRYFTPATGSGQGLAFVGGTTTHASRDALEYFTAEILPRLRRVKGIQALEPISWVGPVREGDRERYRRSGIDMTGYVEDIRPIVRPAACYIVPRRMAGGRTRILQAWAMGKAVVSTSIGCTGLEAVDGENVLIRDEPSAFARAVLDVLDDRSLQRRLGEAGRRTVERHHSWETAGRALVSLYEELETARPLEPASAV